ncbi:MAG: hypothetical protein J6K21_05575 [Bacilli bacterium]|nr:hypothetical protein [Bacilli bacterium]
MEKKIISNIANLIKVKSIITLMTFTAFFYLTINNQIDIDNFMLILGMISTYFFSRNGSKNEV